MWKKEFLSEKRLRPSQLDEKRGKGEMGKDVRNPFESDYGRVLFSSASRRLHDKTQVLPLTTNDNIHSRLTHSMEVMGIGMSMAIYLCKDEEFKEKTQLNEVEIVRQIGSILKSSCLIHDIGNPPFGHFGEQVIQSYFTDLFANISCLLMNDNYDCDCQNIDENGNEIDYGCQNCSMTLGEYIISSLTPEQRDELIDFLNDTCRRADYEQFDGNAEGFRVLTKLQYIGDLTGLNLTSATLATTLKYPNSGIKEKTDIARHKHGVFCTELIQFREIAENCKLSINEQSMSSRRHPFAFLMEAADSICYLVMDIEDGNKKSWLSFDEVINCLKKSNNDDFKKEIEKISNPKDANEKKNWINLRNVLLSHHMSLAIKNFVGHFDDICDGNYNNELIFDNDDVAQILKNIFVNKIVSNREIVSLEITGQAVLTGLFDQYIKLLFHKDKGFRKRAKSMISKTIFLTILHEHFSASDNGHQDQVTNVAEEYDKFDVKDFSVEERFRLIRDYVVCMTDKFALNQFQKLSGQKI